MTTFPTSNDPQCWLAQWQVCIGVMERQAQLAALQSRCFNTAVSDLSLRLCKLNPSRSGAEQPWDLAKSFMSGHTQVKQGTHELRPISASIKVCLS